MLHPRPSLMRTSGLICHGCCLDGSAGSSSQLAHATYSSEVASHLSSPRHSAGMDHRIHGCLQMYISAWGPVVQYQQQRRTEGTQEQQAQYKRTVQSPGFSMQVCHSIPCLPYHVQSGLAHSAAAHRPGLHNTALPYASGQASPLAPLPPHCCSSCDKREDTVRSAGIMQQHGAYITCLCQPGATGTAQPTLQHMGR